MKHPKTIQKGMEYITAVDATELSPLEIRELLRKTVTRRFDIIDRIMAAARKEGIITDKDGMCHFTYETHDLGILQAQDHTHRRDQQMQMLWQEHEGKSLYRIKIRIYWSLWIHLCQEVIPGLFV